MPLLIRIATLKKSIVSCCTCTSTSTTSRYHTNIKNYSNICWRRKQLFDNNTIGVTNKSVQVPSLRSSFICKTQLSYWQVGQQERFGSNSVVHCLSTIIYPKKKSSLLSSIITSTSTATINPTITKTTTTIRTHTTSCTASEETMTTKKPTKSSTKDKTVTLTSDHIEFGKKACEFLYNATDPYHAVVTATQRLQDSGFIELTDTIDTIVKGGKYYYIVHDTTFVAFCVGQNYKPGTGGFHIIGGHTDSPNLSVKPKSKKFGSSKTANVAQIAVQCYGGGLWHTWFDRDLSLSGQVFIRQKPNKCKLQQQQEKQQPSDDDNGDVVTAAIGSENPSEQPTNDDTEAIVVSSESVPVDVDEVDMSDSVPVDGDSGIVASSDDDDAGSKDIATITGTAYSKTILDDDDDDYDDADDKKDDGEDADDGIPSPGTEVEEIYTGEPRIITKLVKISDPVARVSTLCIHLQSASEREAFKVNKEDHTSPIIGATNIKIKEEIENELANQINTKTTTTTTTTTILTTDEKGNTSTANATSSETTTFTETISPSGKTTTTTAAPARTDTTNNAAYGVISTNDKQSFLGTDNVWNEIDLLNAHISPPPETEADIVDDDDEDSVYDNDDSWIDSQEPLLLQRIAKELKLNPVTDKIIDFHLNLYDTQRPSLGGMNQEFLYSARLDNLATVFCATEAIASYDPLTDTAEDIAMIVCFDHEEVGSASLNGAGSPVVEQAVRRISAALLASSSTTSTTTTTKKTTTTTTTTTSAPGTTTTTNTIPTTSTSMNDEGETTTTVVSEVTDIKIGYDELYAKTIENSFCLSIDQAHAIHPNYASKHDPQHAPLMNGGIVIKNNANQRYATSRMTGLLVREIGRLSNVPVQEFAVKNDCPCGSTIGPTISTLTGIRTVDAGMSQLSMHSCREVMGTIDLSYGYQLFLSFFQNFRSVDAKLNPKK